MSLPADLLRLGSADSAIRLRNLSASGFMAECPAPPPLPGTHVVLKLPNIGHMPAQVRWASGSCAGGAFLHELTPEELEGLAAC